MKSIIIIALILGVALSHVPVPPTPAGILYRESPNAKVRLDVFEDILCSDCAAFDPPFKQFLNSELDGQVMTDFVEVYFHPYILPAHSHSFTLSMLNPYIWDLHHNGSVNAAFNEWCFEHQGEYLYNRAKDLSEAQIIDKVCTETDGLFGYNYDECYGTLDSYKYLATIHNAQKYGANYRIYMTPTVMVNGVQLDFEEQPTTADGWYNYFLPYLKE